MNTKSVSRCRELCDRIAKHRIAERDIDYDLTVQGRILIKLLTDKCGWSLRELARKSGLSPTYLSQVANGRVRISHGAYCRIAAAAKIVETF